MRRRDAITGMVGLCVAPGAPRAIAQIRRIAFLGVEPADAAGARRMLESFRAGLAGEGLTEGRDFVVEYSFEPRIDRVAARVKVLAGGRPELFVAITTPVAQAAMKAGGGLPMLFGTVSDPVGSGLVRSLARPGGNVTGVSNMLPALSGKLLEFAKELVPDTARIAVLWNRDNPAKALEADELRAAAARYGVALDERPVRSLQDIERALADAKDQPRVLVILGETLTHLHRARIGALALAQRRVVVSNLSSHAEAGGVLAYQPSYAALHRRLGAMAGRILRGARPADLPVELPATFELFVNARSAKELGLAIPQSLLLRATQVIE